MWNGLAKRRANGVRVDVFPRTDRTLDTRQAVVLGLGVDVGVSETHAMQFGLTGGT